MKERTSRSRQAIFFHPDDGSDVFLPICYSLSELNGFITHRTVHFNNKYVIFLY
jgi:hypothetical protein